ncbi:glycosyltransferase family 39 protein [Actinomycetospora chiangmaiensis]|uniref:glycosyltransferase family 39 protein n=1 Tax=Actinomycetospora chiangmaiensis TaxID=402650 RepID=UPI00036AEFB1|nr:glycosyltransferase family 39 protein [Actinomycetospora chiangmaiensis]
MALPRGRRIRGLRPRLSSTSGWFLGALAIYVAIGAALVLVHDGVMEDALARVSAASSVWSSSDPKLAAIGYVWTPLPVLVMVPFTPLRAVWPELVSRGYLAALLSAVAMAAAVASTWGLLGDLRVRPLPRSVVTVLFALSPMVVFYASNGMTEALLVALLLAAARGLLDWVRSGNPIALVAAGLFLGLGYLARYEALVAAAALAVLVAVISAMRPGTLRGPARRRDAVVVDVLLAAGPTAVAFILWALISWLVVGSPFEQFTSAYGNAALLADAGTPSVSIATPARQLSWLAPVLAPLLVLAVVVALVRRDRWRSLALVAVPVTMFGSVLAFEWATYLTGNLFGFLRYQITAIPLVVVLLALVLARRDLKRGRSRRVADFPRAVGGGLLAVAVLGAGAVTSGSAMLDEPVDATQEYHRVAPLVASALGHPAPSPSALGMWASDRAVAARIDAMHLPRGSVLVDSGAGFAVVAASHHPDSFLITSDDGFDTALADPPAHGIRVVLRSESGGVDAVRTRWSSFGTPAGPGWAHPAGGVAPATPFSSAWSLWIVAATPSPR